MIDDYLDFATQLARDAGKLIYDGFNHHHIVETKDDNGHTSPVTEVDKNINQLVIRRIKNKYPDHGLLGEEANFGNGNERNRWICDPLDGTQPYIQGEPNSCFMIALMQDNKLLLSVVFDPFSDCLYHAVHNKGAYCNGKPIHVNSSELSGGIVLLGSTSVPFIDKIKNEGGKVETVSGGGYKYMQIACGKAVGHIRVGSDFHDIAPGSLIIDEAGGKVTALNGSKLVYDKKISGVIMSNGIVHNKLVEIAQACN